MTIENFFFFFFLKLAPLPTWKQKAVSKITCGVDIEVSVCGEDTHDGGLHSCVLLKETSSMDRRPCAHRTFLASGFYRF